MDVQRVTLKFALRPYSYLSNVYLYNGSTVIASSPLNADTVSKVSATDYEITLSNFTSKVIVPKDGTTVLTVEADVLSAISSDVLATNADTGTTFKVSVTGSGVRAVDGTGLNQYSSDATDTRYVIIKHSQSTNATLTVGLDANTVHAHNIIADTNGTVTGVNLLSFDLAAAKDSVLIDEIDGVTFAADTAMPDSVSLVDASGSSIGAGEEVGSTNVYNFKDLNYTVAKDTTQVLSIKVSDNAVTDGQHYSVTVPGSGFVAEKSNGSSLTATGSASNSGYEAYVYNVGPEFTLNSISVPTTTASNPSGSSTTTSTIAAVFNINVKAVSGDVYFATQNTTENAFAFKYEKDGAGATLIDTVNNTNGSVVYSQPNGSTLVKNSSNSQTFYNVTSGSTVTFAVTAKYNTTSGNSHSYDLRLTGVNWYLGTVTPAAGYPVPILTTSTKTSSYMATDASWISGTATLQ
jgi:hypothetical protein